MIASLLGALLTAGPRKLSIPNRAARNKDLIKEASGERISFIGSRAA